MNRVDRLYHKLRNSRIESLPSLFLCFLGHSGETWTATINASCSEQEPLVVHAASRADALQQAKAGILPTGCGDSYDPTIIIIDLHDEQAKGAI